jgi:hypothetical protein
MIASLKPRRELPTNLRPLYQLTSAIWTIYAAGLALATHGSSLLAFAVPGKAILTTLATLVAIGMIVRAVVPGRPEWTRWTLPLVAGTSVATFTLLLFAADFAGGMTTSRLGFALLILTPAAFAYAHYIGEKVVAPR